ncbi:MAG: EF-P lysine aminoacylase EpmA [Acidobacteriota bacterium]
MTERSAEDWRPTAGLDGLRRRAEILATIRAFFAERGVLEVDTPLLAASTVTDVHLESVACQLPLAGRPTTFYLQTSPEFAMKRLLAAGSGAIYQLAKAVRSDERGRHHNPEFTMLEWYRPGYDHRQLMAEVDDLAQAVLGTPSAERLSYGDAFLRHAEVDPHRADVAELRRAARRTSFDVDAFGDETDRDFWLHVLGSQLVEPHLGVGRPTLLFDYPASQAALARIRPGRGGSPAVAERFELYIDGVELANGFHELLDAEEQRRRFENDLRERRERKLPEGPVDERLLAALWHGLPPCAGVALGVDRLVMLAAGADAIDEVIAFPIERA